VSDEAQILRVDAPAHRVFVGANHLNVRLSKQEFELLRHLYHRRGQTCSREELADLIWGSVDVGGKSVARSDEHMLHALIHRVRTKFRNAGVDLNRYVVSVPGIGYRLEATPQNTGDDPGPANSRRFPGTVPAAAWIALLALGAAAAAVAIVLALG